MRSAEASQCQDDIIAGAAGITDRENVAVVGDDLGSLRELAGDCAAASFVQNKKCVPDHYRSANMDREIAAGNRDRINIGYESVITGTGGCAVNIDAKIGACIECEPA